MRILRLEAENVKRLVAVEIDAPGGLVEIQGKNEHGKSSLLDCISFAIGGKKLIDAEPIRKGEDKAKIVLDLGKYEITRTFTRTKAGGSIKVKAKDGSPFSSPQALLDGFVSDFSFDPMRFVQMNQEEMVKILQGLLKIEIDHAKLGEFINSDSSGENCPPLQAIQGVIKTLYDWRTDAGRTLKSKEAAFRAIEIPEGMEDVLLKSTTELMEKRQELVNQKNLNDAFRDELTAYRDNIASTEDTLKSIKQQITELEAQKEEEEINLQILIRRETTRANMIDSIEPVDFTAIDEEIAGIDEHNRIANHAISKRTARAEFKEAEKNHGELEGRLEAVREYRKEVLASAEFPVKGLNITEEGIVTFQDVPLDQRGTSKKILVGLAIGASLNPELRVILIKDGNDLDGDNMETLRTWAEKNDYQIWIERVADRPDGVSFYIEDGSIKSSE